MTTTASQPVVAASPARSGFWLPLGSLWRRELVRFARQPSRVAGLLAAPLLFWLFIGSGLGESFQPSASPSLSSSLSGGYLQYFFPGTVVMIVLFTSIFSNMSTIEDRREGFLQSVLAAPIPRSSLVLGKVLGGTTQALVPGVLFLLLAPFAGFRPGAAQMAAALTVLFLIALSLSSLGFAIAWWMDSVQGFHAVLNLVLLPMWLLSGAVFPASGAAEWVQWIMRANPLAYEVSALREALAATGPAAGLSISFQVTLLFAAACAAAALVWAGKPSVRHAG